MIDTLNVISSPIFCQGLRDLRTKLLPFRRIDRAHDVELDSEILHHLLVPHEKQYPVHLSPGPDEPIQDELLARMTLSYGDPTSLTEV